MTEFSLGHLEQMIMNAPENSSDSSTGSSSAGGGGGGGGLGGGGDRIGSQQDSGSGSSSSGGDSPQVVPDFPEEEQKPETIFVTGSISTTTSTPITPSTSSELVTPIIESVGIDTPSLQLPQNVDPPSTTISLETALLIVASGGNPSTVTTTTSRTLANSFVTSSSTSQASSSRLPVNGVRTYGTTPGPVTSQQQIIKIEPIMTEAQTEGTPQMTAAEAAFLLASLGRDETPRRASPPLPSASGKRPSSSSHLEGSMGGLPSMVKKMRRPMDVKLPISTVDELDMLEMQIEESTMLKAKLLNRLAKIGGKNFGQCVRNALKALMTDAVAVQLNWAGRGGKKPFQSYEIKSVLFDAVRMSFPKVTDFQLKDPVQCWLKRSRNYQPRDLKSRKKSSPPQPWMKAEEMQ